MKKCKSCDAAMDDEVKVCPECGAVEAEQEAPKQEPAKKKTTKKSTRNGLIIGLVLAVLVVVGVIVGKGYYDQNRGEKISTGLHTNAYGYETYAIHYATGENDQFIYSYMNQDRELIPVRPSSVKKLMDEVVATCGEMKLTNRELQYYYNQAYYAFYSQNSSLMSYIMDVYTSYGEQLDLDGEQTWEAFFVDYAIELFQEMSMLYQEAEKAGYTMSEEEEAALEEALDLTDVAETYGFDSVLEMMQMRIGPGVTEETYREFSRVCAVAQSYGKYLMDNMEVTEQDINDYYDNNAEMMVNDYRVEKIDKNMIDIRHILIAPVQSTDANGNTTITEEAWAEAEAKAQEIYEGWQKDGASEEAFAELAGTHTEDGGSKNNGGLYEEVAPGQMVENFDAWCFEDGRKAGDHGIVKTEFGYHIMYFVGECDLVYWEMAAEQLFRQEQGALQRDEMVEALNPTVDLSKALILDVTAPSKPEAPTAPTGGLVQ